MGNKAGKYHIQNVAKVGRIREMVNLDLVPQIEQDFTCPVTSMGQRKKPIKVSHMESTPDLWTMRSHTEPLRYREVCGEAFSEFIAVLSTLQCKVHMSLVNSVMA